MLCEHYEDALVEVAAAGAARQGELRAHLDSCASCRATFYQEQSLFAAINSGIHAAANAEVPPSLLPRVRAGLDGATLARSGSSWFVLVGAAVAAAVVLFAVTTRRNNSGSTPTNLVANRTPAPHLLPSAEGASPSLLPKNGNSAPRTPVSTARNSTQRGELTSQKHMPETLVPRDQEILLASYAQQWDSRKHPPVLAGEVDQKAAALLEIPPIQITELDVKPLAEGTRIDSRDPGQSALSILSGGAR